MNPYEALGLLKKVVSDKEQVDRELSAHKTVKQGLELDLARAKSLIETLEKTNKELHAENERLHAKISTMKQLASLDGTLRQLYFGKASGEEEAPTT